MKYSTKALIQDISIFLRPHKVKFVMATALRICSDLAWLYPVYAIASIVNFLSKYLAGDSLQPLLFIAYLFALAICVRFGAGYSARRLMYSLSERVCLDAQLFGIAHMFKIDIAWHERENTGNKLKKIVRGGESIDKILRM